MTITLLDAAFPQWTSIELFGPTAAGKTHFAKKLEASGTVIASPHTGRDRLAKFVGSIAGRKIRRAYENWRIEYEFFKRLTHSTQEQAYYEAVFALLDRCNFPHDKRRNHLQAICRASRAATEARGANQRIIIDEGIVRRIMALRVVLKDSIDTPQCSGCLALYPWDKNAILITTSRETRMARLKVRNELSSDAHMAHALDDEAGDFAADLCRRNSWNVVTVSGE